ncbi:MAG: hypothetical protein PUK59_00600 [Actinomycetaceae bacterium]|nr:hypothetical protein [Actinomycetaceae bacterium]MDY5854573.1 hypothetical protein [Arcanobacterium sp.]
MKKLSSLTIASTCALALSISTAGVAGATEITTNSASPNVSSSLASAQNDSRESISVTEAEAVELATKIARAGSAFRTSIVAPGKFAIKVSDKELQSKYNFTADETNLLHSFSTGQSPFINITNRTTTAVSDRAAKLFHISNADLQAGTFAFLATAAEAGPAAVAAIWPLLTSLAGPLGTAAGLVTGALGGAFFADIATKVVGALHQGKGITFYSDWAFPPITVKIEGK